jgi:hypothetical protein
MLEIFEQVDESKSGQITPEDLRAILVTVKGQSLDEKMINRILNDVDEDKSGHISFTEFKKVTHIGKPDPEEFPEGIDEDDFTLEFLPADELAKIRAARAKKKRERDVKHHVLK